MTIAQLSADILSALVLAQEGDAPDASWWQTQLNNPIWLIVFPLLLFYVLILLPERRKRADLTRRLASLKKNDRVVTIGGIYGTIVNAPSGSDDITLRVDDSTGARLRVTRSAISKVIGDEAEGEKKAIK